MYLSCIWMIWLNREELIDPHQLVLYMMELVELFCFTLFSAKGQSCAYHFTLIVLLFFAASVSLAYVVCDNPGDDDTALPSGADGSNGVDGSNTSEASKISILVSVFQLASPWDVWGELKETWNDKRRAEVNPYHSMLKEKWFSDGGGEGGDEVMVVVIAAADGGDRGGGVRRVGRGGGRRRGLPKSGRKMGGEGLCVCGG
ncbi:hypothetical protein Tco_0108810 [Tanacetum coccineum]